VCESPKVVAGGAEISACALPVRPTMPARVAVCIMCSLCGAGGSKGIGFLADIRRMNVGLTRGRLAMLVVGRRDTLERNGHWRSLIQHAVATGALVPVSCSSR
jgi:hypothetical protein